MEAIGLTEFGGPDVLRVVRMPTPEPGEGEVRIRVYMVAVNPTDATFRAGGRAAQLADRTPPYVPGMDAAGVVDKVGPGTSGRLSAGARVIALVIPMGPHGGTYAEQIVAGEASVVRAPKGATDAEAATLLLNAVAARLALDALGLSAGQAVAVTGAAGAVGGYAIQLAKARGLTVVADASPGGEDAVGVLGADHVVARGAGFAGQVRALVPGGVPGLVDGANLDAAALRAIADGGAIASLKGWSGPAERGITVRPISAFGSVTDTALLEELRDLAEDGTLSLHVAEIMPARLAPEAHRRLAAGGIRGRIVLDFETPLTSPAG
jgi:NADPH:quinone reductase-like Zn-dependent oxidoreductase